MPTFLPRKRAVARAALAVGGLVLVGSLAACSSIPFLSGNDADASTAQQWLSEPAGEPIWSAEVDTFSNGASIIEDRVVSLVSKGAGQLAMSAWDANTGELVWEQPASTGDVSSERTWPVTILEGADGRPLIANLAPPVATYVDLGMQETPFGLSNIGRNIPMHLVQFIDVQTGAIVAETERETMYVWNTCGFVNAICARVLSIEKLVNGEQNPYDEKLIHSTGEIGPLFPDGYLSGFSTSAQIFVVDKADGTTAMIRYDGNEVKWELDLAQVGLGTTLTSQLAFGAQRTSEGDSSLVQVTLTDQGDQSSTLPEFSTSPVLLMIDWVTGELLWNEQGLSHASGGLFESGDAHFVRDVNGSYQPQREATTLLESRDLLTGEREWEIEMPGLQTALDDLVLSLSTGEEDTTLFFTNEGWTRVDLTTGEPREIKEDYMFACTSRGPGVMLPEGSDPDNPEVAYTSNSYTAGCFSDGTRITEPNEVSKAAVADATSAWQPFSDEPTDTQAKYQEERVRVITNETGIHAYRF